MDGTHHLVIFNQVSQITASSQAQAAVSKITLIDQMAAKAARGVESGEKWERRRERLAACGKAWSLSEREERRWRRSLVFGDV